jgi:hypothetical protein
MRSWKSGCGRSWWRASRDRRPRPYRLQIVERDPDDPGPGRPVQLSMFVDGDFKFALEYEPEAAIDLAVDLLGCAQFAKRPIGPRRPPTEAERAALRRLCGGERS